MRSVRQIGRMAAELPTLVFDLDGTLAHTAPDILATLNAVLASLGHPPLPDQHAITLVGSGARALLAEGLKAANVTFDQARLDHLFAQFLEHYEAHIADHTQLYPGALAALDRLTDEGYRLAVCTNKMVGHSTLLLDKLGVSDRFAAICGRDSFPFFKPDARHLTMTVTQSGGDPSRAIMVGDSRTDIDTARNAKLPVIGVSFGYSDVPLHTLAPNVMIDHFDQLHAAVSELSAVPR